MIKVNLIIISLFCLSCVFDRNRELEYFVINNSDTTICIATKLKMEDSIAISQVYTKDTFHLYSSDTRGWNFENSKMDYFEKDLRIFRYDCKSLKTIDSVDFTVSAEKSYLNEIPAIFIKLP